MDDLKPTNDEVQALIGAARRSAVRQKIKDDAGDTLSLLGTASDGASLALLSTVAHTTAVAQARAAMQAEGGEDADGFALYADAYLEIITAMSPGVVEASQKFMAGVQSGDVRLPPMAKGFEEVIGDVVARGNAVTDAIAASRATQE